MTLVLVTHDASVAARADRVVRMLDGKVDSRREEEEPRPVKPPEPTGARSRGHGAR
jgi:ABC-type lipoprotein export system ATPase subunit